MEQVDGADSTATAESWHTLQFIERLTGDGVLMVDHTGVIRFFGGGLGHMLGYSPDEMQVQAVSDVAPTYVDWFAAMVHTLETGHSWPGACIRVNRRDGSLADLQISAQSLPGPNSGTEYIVLLVRDVTKHERFQALHRCLTEVTSAVSDFAPLDQILRMVRDAIIEFGGFDRAGVFQVMGKEVHGAWGTDESGRPRSEAGLVETLDDWGPAIADLTSGTRHFVIEPLPPDALKPGLQEPIAHVVIPMRAGAELVGLISADNLLSRRPVTEADVLPLIPFAEEAAVAIRSIRLHSRVQSYADDLKREVARRTEELEAVVSDLEQFSYRVAHDVRAPFRAIDGLAHLLLEDIAAHGYSPERVLSALERISLRAMYGGRLVDDLLTFAQMGRRPFAPSRVQLEAAVLEAWQNTALQRKGGRVELVLGDLLELWADRSMVVELLTRVLDNALKFTRQTPCARIEVGTEADEAAGTVILYVRDNGIGLQPEDAGRVFGAFAQLNSPDEYEGSGIGLAIVKRIMDRHGGRVWLTGAPGHGATLFCVFASP